MPHFVTGSVALFVYLVCIVPSAQAVPYFARSTGTTCTTCHVIPPKLNQTGETFLARGYTFPNRQPLDTFPFAVWASGRIEDPEGIERKAFHNRIELIAAGTVRQSNLYYFVEWRAISQELKSDGSIRDRSGRFEDLFVAYADRSWTFTVGQFRALSQVDVSRRLANSEPVAFSAGLTGKKAEKPRTTSLRAFSPAGRSPSVRLSYFRPRGSEAIDNWYLGVTVPFGGELSFPLTQEAHTEASLELETRPKGVFVETYYRSGLSSIGVHGFLGNNDRWLAQLVGVCHYRTFFSTLGVGGASKAKNKEFRISWDNEFVPVQWVAVGVRYDQRKEEGKDSKPAFHPHLNLQFPASDLTLRLAIERRIQSKNNLMTAEFSFIF